jgi:hypothetical protein
MKLEQQVCSLDLAKRLKELGVKQEGYFVWAKPAELSQPGYTDDYHLIISSTYDYIDSVSAFTVAELGEMLPAFIGDWVLDQIRMTTMEFGLVYRDNHKYLYNVSADTEADARAKMLIYLTESHII